MTRNQEILYKHCSDLSYRDYRQANPQQKGRRRKPYALSMETEEAHSAYALSLKAELTPEQKTELMAYLLRLKLATNILEVVA